MSNTSLPSIFNNFNSINALIIGDVMIDSYIWGSVERMSPEAPVPIVRVDKRDFRLGGAANVALNIQALGATPIICAVVGHDDEGNRFIERLGERDISSDGIVLSDERPTTVKTRVISDNQHMVRIDEESDAEITTKETISLKEKIKSLIIKCQVVIFEDYDKGSISPEIITYTVNLAKQHNIPTVVDPKKRNFMDYHGVTLFKPNLKELKEGLHVEFDVTDQEQLEEAVNTLLKHLSCDSALITLSEHGVYVCNQESRHHFAAHIREIADVSGAGDTVISIAALCVALGLSYDLVAQLSNLGGGLVCEHVGVVTINKQLLLEEAQQTISNF
ncbi:MAG: bifunctional ADP-heptose synthase [Cyclobacteriaceae bacterium]|nr:bifunctional ADP-heptose synthase [Cyclobacteriaceae bacterium]